MHFSRQFLLLSPVLALLCGCQAAIDAPSLAPRPTERQPILEPAPASEGDSTLDPALGQRLAAILSAAEEGDAVFARARTDAETAVRRAEGQAEGSDSWVAAQQALSALEAARAPVQAQLTALEDVRQDPAYAALANRDAIEVAGTRIAAIADAQAATLQALAARLR
jgi:hypothetical protein